MDASRLLHKYAGQWVAWNRQQDRVIATGRTFEEAKQSAAATGECSVVLKKASRKGSARPHWLYAVAVFIALAPSANLQVAARDAASPLASQDTTWNADEDDLKNRLS
jgi:hypothetical protein